MSEQKITGYAIVVLILLAFWWLLQNLGLIHSSNQAAADLAQSGVGDTTSVQSGIVGGSQNTPTISTYPCAAGNCA